MGYGAGDLAGNEGLSTAGRFVIEQDSAGGVKSVAFAVVDGNVMPEDFGAGVRAARMEGGCLRLRRRRAAEHLARRRLVEARAHPGAAKRFEQAQGSHASDVHGVFRDL